MTTDQPADLVSREDRGAVACLTLNAPGSLNALSLAMIGRLAERLAEVGTEEAVRVVVLRGAGRAFCAGHDLREMQGMRDAPDGGQAALSNLFEACSRVMCALPRLPQPVIAQVHGIATAAGCQLVAACDMAVAEAGTRFGVNGIDVGLFCSTPAVALSRAVAPKPAFEMLTTGGFVEAARARELGLINRVAEPGRLEEETMALAETLAAKPASALRMGKRAFRDQLGLGLEEAYRLAGAVMVANMMEAECAEGIAAFIEKRPPAWRNEG